MRYPAAEKAEIIQLVEQSHLSAKRALAHLTWRAIWPGGSGTKASSRARGTVSSPAQGKSGRWHQALKNRTARMGLSEARYRLFGR